MGKKVPDPTPPKETSAAATGTNVATAIANAFLNNPTIVGPDGITRTRQTGTYTIYDPYTKLSLDVPKLTTRTKLSEMGQKIYDQTQGTKLGLATLANDQARFLNDYMSKPFSYNPGQHEKWALGLYDALNRDKLANDNEQMRTQLTNSGIRLGSDAYEAAARSLGKSQMDARNQFLLDSYNTGFNTEQATRNQPLNEISALQSGSQVAQPMAQFNPSRIPTTDNAAIIANYDQQRIAGAQANQNLLGNVLGGLFSLGAAGIRASDRRVKKDIEKTGSVAVRGDDGRMHRTSTYRYRYAWENDAAPPQHGVMAQNIERIKPSAVLTLGSGLKAVDYDKILGVA